MTPPASDQAQTNVNSKDVTFRSGEHLLTGKLFYPAHRPLAIVVLNGATGVPARFYGPFAQWLAHAKGFACLIYDYRDFGASRRWIPRKSKATIADWGVHDQQAARDFARQCCPDLPLWVIGHSLGGMCLPFQRDLDGVDRLIAVASGLVNVRDHPWPYQGFARFFWFGLVPLTTWIAGYLPGKFLRLGADLPKGVYWQWRRWCTRRDFFAQDFGVRMPFPDWTGLKAPAKFVAIADDVMTPPETVWRLMRCYPSAPKTQTVLRPSDFGLSGLGHVNVFAEKSRAVWDQIVA